MNGFKKYKIKTILKYFINIFTPLLIILAVAIYFFYSLEINNGNLLGIIQVKGFFHIIIICLLMIISLSFASAYMFYKKNIIKKGLKIARDIFENASEAILLTDTKTRIIYVNKSFSNITGYTKKEVLGLRTSYFKSGRHDSKFYKEMWTSINKRGRWQGEIWDKRKSNKIYPKFLTILAIKDDYNMCSGYIGIFDDLSDLKRKEEKINKLKNYDTVTSLPNIILMKKMFEKRKLSIKDSKKASRKNSCRLLSLIISNYDVIKNTLGISDIDDLIVQFSNRIKENFNEDIMLSRTGNDEFVIFIEESIDEEGSDEEGIDEESIDEESSDEENIDEEGILKLAEEILSWLKDSFAVQDKIVYLKIAIGISSYPKDADNIDELIEKANIARAYALDEENHVVLYEEGLKDKYLNKLKMENLLREALEKEEIYLNYQPQVELENEKIVGGEALLRWNSPELGNVPPYVFIPIAERTNMIIPIGKWILEEVCKKISYWREKYNKSICIAVNISPVQFKKTNMYTTIKEVIEKYHIPGECLEIEITEGLLMDNVYQTKRQLKKIKSLGVKVAMDDFGTGYSSLSYLRKFNFDKLKIDREFVKDYPKKEDGTIAKIIIELSHSLKLKVIAEGVETQEQMEFMKKSGCDQIQGYYYSPPLMEDKFEELLKKGLLH